MTHPTDIDEIAEAVALLERAEREFPSQQSADAFSEAFDLLNDALDFAQPDEVAQNYVRNVKYAHCKRIAGRLAEVNRGDFEVWFHYAVLLLVKMKPEFDTLRAEHPDLGVLFDRCMGVHGAVLQAAAVKIANGD